MELFAGKIKTVETRESRKVRLDYAWECYSFFVQDKRYKMKDDLLRLVMKRCDKYQAEYKIKY